MPSVKKTTRKPAKPVSESTSKVQGEGDYESARKYNERTRAFVQRMAAGKLPAPKDATVSQAELTAAEKKALARSRGRAGDKADARAMTAKVATSTRSRRRG